MKFLLSVIALCLVMITTKLYIPEAQAEVAGMDSYDLRTDYDFKKAVEYIAEDIAEDIVEDCTVSGWLDVQAEYASNLSISC